MTRLDYTIVTSISTPTTLDQTHRIVLVTNGSTITLPDATDPANQQILFNIIRTGSSNVLIDTTSAQTISGDPSLTLVAQWDSCVVVSDGTNWVRCS